MVKVIRYFSNFLFVILIPYQNITNLFLTINLDSNFQLQPISQEMSAPVAATPAAPVAAAKPKVVKPKAAAKPKKAATHPKFSVMIGEAIKKLAERSGSSRQAILKFIVANYHLDAKVANQHLKMALKAGVKNGSIKQSKGLGASGSFKIGEVKKAAKPKKVAVKKPAAKKVVKAKKPKVAATAKPKIATKPKAASAAKPKKAAAAKPKVAKKVAAPKAKAAAKPKVAKPKVVKPKVAKVAKKAAPKAKAAAKPKA
jgi:histone H1/5